MYDTKLTLEVRKSDIEEKVKGLKDDITIFIKDPNIPLEERWEVFSTFPEYLFEEEFLYIINYPILVKKKFNYYNDMFVERYETIDASDIVGHFEEIYDEKGDINEFYKSVCRRDVVLTLEEIDILKEQILERGCRTFKYDW